MFATTVIKRGRVIALAREGPVELLAASDELVECDATTAWWHAPRTAHCGSMSASKLEVNHAGGMQVAPQGAGASIAFCAFKPVPPSYSSLMSKPRKIAATRCFVGSRPSKNFLARLATSSASRLPELSAASIQTGRRKCIQPTRQRKYSVKHSRRAAPRAAEGQHHAQQKGPAGACTDRVGGANKPKGQAMVGSGDLRTYHRAPRRPVRSRR